MKKLQVPFNLDRNLFDVYTKYKDNISQVYFAPHPNLFPTARQFKTLTEEEMMKLECDLCDHLHTLSISSYILLNGTNIILTNDIYLKIYSILSELSDHYLSGVVVANPVLGDWVHTYFPELKIKYSILSNMDSVEKIKLVDGLNYVDEICLPLSFNKKLDLLKRLKEETKIKYSIIVNSLCRIDCPLYGWHHTLFNSNKDIATSEFSTTHKFLEKYENELEISEDLTGYLLPTKLKEYEDMVDGFKLEDRTMSTSKIETVLYYYVNDIDPKDRNDCIHGSCMSYKI